MPFAPPEDGRAIPALAPNTDPLIVALDGRWPLDAAVLCAAIKYREALVDQLVQEIDVLKVTRARILNAPAGG